VFAAFRTGRTIFDANISKIAMTSMTSMGIKKEYSVIRDVVVISFMFVCVCLYQHPPYANV